MKTLRYVYYLHDGNYQRCAGSHIVKCKEEFPVSGLLFTTLKYVKLETKEGRVIRSWHDKYKNLIVSIK